MKISKKLINCLVAPALTFVAGVSSAKAAQIPGYCVAIRGNGELVPAHWGAMAQTIENFGPLSGMAGGSSGSITTFLWESMMANPLVREMPPTQQGQTLALLFKSLEGVIELQLSDPKWQSVINAIKLGESSQNQQSLKEALGHLSGIQNASDLLMQKDLIFSAISALKNSGILYGPAVQKLAYSYNQLLKEEAPRAEQIQYVFAEVLDLKKTISVFGKFDAKNDTQLFIRDGLLNFSALAEAIGQLADMLALRNISAESINDFKIYEKNCAPQAVGESWAEVKTKNPDCVSQLATWVTHSSNSYRASMTSRLNDRVGQYAPVLVSTAVVRGPESLRKFLTLKSDYELTHNPSLGSDMVVPSTDLRFGYWGQKNNLIDVSHNLDRNIDKSQRFMALGAETWKQVLSLSPAEPGLSPFVNFQSALTSERLISIGGWSDLHPVPVLKAMGCENVVYVTRRGGDSLFGAGVAKRIRGFANPDWNLLVTQADPQDPNFAQVSLDKKNSTLHNMNGDPQDLTSDWSMMFNLKNPSSSFASSLAQAAAVVCTDWNAYDIKKDFNAMILQAYQSPIYRNGPSTLPRLKSSTPNLTKADLGAPQNQSADGYPIFAGCIPY